MPQFKETPGKFILGVLIQEVATGNEWVLCKACYCKEYELDESSVSTATAQPQPDMLVEKHIALIGGDTCSKCNQNF